MSVTGPVKLPYMEVDLGQIKKNLFEICKKTRKDLSQVIAVVKDNSYGLGAGMLAKTLQSAGVLYFAVATIDEAVFLRENGVTGNILLLGMTDETCFKTAAKYKIILSIIDPTQIKSVEKSQNIKWHLNIDTGMHRDGINSESLEQLMKVKSFVSGVYTHYHSSDDEDQSCVVLQQNKFRKAVLFLQNAGFNFDIIHSSNSGACAYSDIAENEFIRPGVLLYGCRPDPNRNPEININETVKIYAQISSIREIKKGDGVSYGHVWTTPKDTKIATISIGYANGFPRALSKTAFVTVNSKKYPIVGRVTMDYIMVDIGDETQINVGDTAVIIGIDELALCAKTIGYELLCKFGAALNHRYVENGELISLRERILF